MAAASTSPLTERLQEMLQGMTLKAAVFTTYTLDPGFFEHHVVSALFDLPYHQNPSIRIAQLDDHLRNVVDVEIDVFYDPRALTEGSDMSAKLDVGRIPVVIPNGVFHPKVFVILGERDKDDSTTTVILLGTASANLTRAGWWENLEFVHIEEFEVNANAALPYDVADFLRSLKSMVHHGMRATAVETILRHLPTDGPQPTLRKKENDRLRTRLLHGSGGWHDSLASVLRGESMGFSLEIISPYVDDKAVTSVLVPLLKKYKPKVVRISLPTSKDGEITISEHIKDAVADVQNVEWGVISSSVCSRHKDVVAPSRFVHAKLYRFLSVSAPKREIVICGSLNLTSAAWMGPNYEAVVIIESSLEGKPILWIETGTKPPTRYAEALESELPSFEINGAYPSILYDHESRKATLNWQGGLGEQEYGIRGADGVILELATRPTRVNEEYVLPTESRERLERQLATRSKVTVFTAQGREYAVLISEHNMYLKAPLVESFTIAQIIEFWSTLSAERRAQLIESRMNVLGHFIDAVDTMTDQLMKHYETLFDRIAGVFAGIASIEERIADALGSHKKAKLKNMLYGASSTSMISLARKIDAKDDGKETDSDDRLKYLIAVSMKDLLQRIENDVVTMEKRSLHEFLRTTSPHWTELQATVASALVHARERLLIANVEDGIEEFVLWFERVFMNQEDLSNKTSDIQ